MHTLMHPLFIWPLLVGLILGIALVKKFREFDCLNPAYHDHDCDACEECKEDCDYCDTCDEGPDPYCGKCCAKEEA